MSTQTYTALATSSAQRMILDCRGMNFDGDADVVLDSVLKWVMSFPQPRAMHVYLPSSTRPLRRLQCTLQGLGCAVSRVTKTLSARS